MKTYKITAARKNLYDIVDEATISHQPIQITGKRGSAILVSEEDWIAIQETFYLISVPGMRDSILEGMQTPIEETSESPGW